MLFSAPWWPAIGLTTWVFIVGFVMPRRRGLPKSGASIVALAALAVIASIPGVDISLRIPLFIVVIVLALVALKESSMQENKIDEIREKLDGLRELMRGQEGFREGDEPPSPAVAPRPTAEPPGLGQPELQPLEAAEGPQTADEGGEPALRVLTLDNYGEATRRADAASTNTSVLRLFCQTPEPGTFQDQVRQLAYDLKRMLRYYHGSLDVDSFVAPEVVRATSKQIIDTRRRVRDVLGRNPFSHYTDLPMTVHRMARLADELDIVAREIPAAERPIVW